MSAVALTATSLGAMALGCLVVGTLGQLASAHASLDATADLTALAVASRAVRGEPATSACATGGAVATADGARLMTCEAVGPGGDGSVVVVVTREVVVLGLRAELEATARAGPGSARPP